MRTDFFRNLRNELREIQRSLPRRAWYEARTFAGRYHWFLKFWKLKHRDSPRLNLAIRENTELVLEGFPRSANTFAVVAFEHAQGRSVGIAHHLHVPSLVLEGIQKRLPVVLLIRHPHDVAISMVLRYPHMTLAQVLRGYYRYYEPLVPLRQNMIVAPFEQVISDFGSIIERTNKKFGTSFDLYSHASDRMVFDEIEAIYARQNQGRVSEMQVSRPSARRRKQREEVSSELSSPSIKPALERARQVYDAITISSHEPDSPQTKP